ncbi:MAG: hypothetical protein O7D35_10540 [Acidobacteria bacterium]|nr:hypothetical protein [Acidobacteriota bacterium]
MAYLRISFVVAALLAAMSVAGFNGRNSSSAAPGAETLGEQVWDGSGSGGSTGGRDADLICTGCK